MEDKEYGEFKIVLLLGSYDKETKNILDRVKDEIAKYSTNLKEYIFLLLEDVEIYYAEGNTIVIEKFDNKVTAIILEGSLLKDVIEFSAKTQKDIENKLKERGYTHLTISPILEKLNISHRFFSCICYQT